MKKIILILFVFLSCLQITGFSQKSRVGVTAGLSIADMSGKQNGESLNDDSQIGYTFGMIVDAPIQDHFSFQPGLHYVQKGRETTLPGSPSAQKKITALRYAELQLNFLYNTGEEVGSFFIGAGPTVSVNLPSKYVTKTGNIKAESDITFGNKQEDLRAFDYGVDFLVGFGFMHGVIFSANYTLGLRNLVPSGSATSDKLKNNYVGIRIGFLVNNK
jgi:hypothetical protein